MVAAFASCGVREDPAALFAEGKRLMEKKQYAASIQPLSRAFAADEQLVAAGISLAEVLIQEERFVEVLDTCERVDRVLQAQGKPRDPEGVKNRSKTSFLAARALKETGRPADAERAVLRSLQWMPRNASARALLGAVLSQLGRHSEAVPNLEEALVTIESMGAESGAEQIHYQLAQSLAALGRTADAEAHLKRHRELKIRSDLKSQGERAREYEALASEAGSPKGGPRSTPQSVDGATPSAPQDRAAHPGDLFTDRAREAGLDFRHDSGARGDLQVFETIGGGAAWLDYDLDGDPDLYLVSGQASLPGGDFPREGKNRLYRNDGGRFIDVTVRAGAGGRGYGLGAISGDIDNDGDPDLYVLCFGPNLLLRNRGDGTFEPLEASGTEGIEPFSGGAAFADLDGDGLLDLFVSSYFRYDPRQPQRCFERSLRNGQVVPIYCGPISFTGSPCHVYRNLGNGKFRDVSRESNVGLGPDAASKGLGVLAADLDEDGDIDVYVACDTTANLLYRNRGNGAFDEVGLESGVAVSDSGLYEGSMGIALGDANDDGLADLFVTNFAEESNRLYLGLKGGGFSDGTARTGVGMGSRPLVGWGAAFLDVGCDRKIDLLVTNGHIYHNAEEWLPRGTYRQRMLLHVFTGERCVERGEAAGESVRRPGAYRGLALADYDLDGDVDALVVELDRPPILLRAENPHGHWLEVDLVGTGRGGRDAIGARVEIESPSGRQIRWRHGGGSYLSASEGRLHFGLGTDERILTLTVTWPDRKQTLLRDLKVDQRVRVER